MGVNSASNYFWLLWISLTCLQPVISEKVCYILFNMYRYSAVEKFAGYLIIWNPAEMSNGVLLYFLTRAIWWYLGSLTYPVNVSVNLHYRLLQNQKYILSFSKSRIMSFISYVCSTDLVVWKIVDKFFSWKICVIW